MIIVFAGTSDARDYVYKLADAGQKLLVCVTTSYGASLYRKDSNIEVMDTPLDISQIEALIKDRKPEKIIDATHPYADLIHANLKAVCQNIDVKLEVKTRQAFFSSDDKGCIFVDSYKAAADYLASVSGKILMTIGSRRLGYFVDRLAIDRMVVRVLPTSSVLKSCEDLGFSPKNIIAMQGPFSEDFNQITYKDYDIKYIVTKDSGKVGGVEQKVMAAKKMGVQVVVIKRSK